MPIYLFEGRSSDGKPVTGKRLSQSIDSLIDLLSKEGITPIKITPEEKSTEVLLTIKDKYFKRKVTPEQLSMFIRQMYTLYKSGVSLTAAIRQLSQTTENSSLSEALNGVVQSLEGGKDLANAMSQYPTIFTPIVISMIGVGQNTGRLDEAFLDLHEYLELETSAIKQVKTILRYPTLVMVALFCAAIIICVFVIPTFARVFAQANIPLPAITQALITVSQFVLHYWIFIVIALSIMIGSIYHYLHTPQGTYELDKYQLRLPGIGSLLRRVLLLRFAQSFSVVVKSGIPMVEGLGLVAQSIQNEYGKREIQKMQLEIQHGKSLTQAAMSVSLFTPLEIQMLSVSDETGELTSILEHLAAFYQREVSYSMKKLGDIIEPLLILGVSILVLGLALAVYLPIWNLIKLVHS